MRSFLKKGGDRTNWARRYLLGRGSAVVRAAVEEKFFSDREKFELLRAAEDDLVDDYLCGNLSRSDRETFERKYLATPEHQEKVAFARALSARLNPAATPPRGSWFGLQPLWAVGWAAGLLIVAAGVWWAMPRRLPRAVPPVPSAVAPATPKPVLAFVLSPSVLRDPGPGQTLHVPKDAGPIELRTYPELDGFDDFDAEVQTPEGKQVWTAVNLHTGPDRFLGVLVPAEKLNPGDYLLFIHGHRDSVTAESGIYSFRLVRE